MFDIGFLELLIIGIMALLVLGPERLPGAVRTTTLWITRIRRSFQQIKLEIEREVDIAELKQQIHNDSIMEKLEQTKTDIEKNVQETRENLQKELGDENYNLSDLFTEQDNSQADFPDTLPDHDPLPDPDEERTDTPQQKPHDSNDKS